MSKSLKLTTKQRSHASLPHIFFWWFLRPHGMCWQGTSAFHICFGKQHPGNIPMASVVTGEKWAQPANAHDRTYKQSSNQFPLSTVPRPIVCVSNQEVGREEFSTKAELAIKLQYKWERTGHIKALNVILILLPLRSGRHSVKLTCFTPSMVRLW